ncbi:MAG: polymer-forming cytoskeletal protein [Acidobacteria bacterium]|nr:polymer-forming cytoskeletal protein [Acidobacteriota bacterium]
MWNRRKEEDFAVKPAAMPPSSAELTKEGMPMSTLPGRSMELEAPRGTASIGKSVIVKGNIYSREDLFIDGELDGAIELQEHRLTIGANGKVASNSVKAREIVVLGTIHGNVEASDKIEIRKDAKLVGDIKTARIVIEDGAYFKGSIDIVKTETGKATMAAAPKTPVTAAPANATLPLASGSGDPKR